MTASYNLIDLLEQRLSASHNGVDFTVIDRRCEWQYNGTQWRWRASMRASSERTISESMQSSCKKKQ